MSVSELRSKVRAVILGITGLLIAFLFARLILDLIGADRNNPFVEFIKQISDFLSEPFESLASNDTQIQDLNVDILVSIFLYFIIGLILAETITAFIYDNIEDIIQNFVDAIYKIVEFILFLRIVFDFFEVNERAKFISAIYNLTKWTDGLINIDPLNGRLNFSVIVILIIVVVFDILTESLIRGVLRSGSTKTTTVTSSSGGYAPQNISVVPVPTHSAPMQPMRQNITVNIPAQNMRPMTNTIIQPTRVMAVPVPTYAQSGQVIPTSNVNINTQPPSYQRFAPSNMGNAQVKNESLLGKLSSKAKKFFRS